ncbi:hypothetical protein DM02DRAFT_655800 [Periconia macrospinosa]|uniref:Uncharacterized protein n=1 Tax=Periconia macrospinosa TaxID=97972 RepID=A0A2V1DQ85_9PLEO|nr:hypothetical protein DM02DRAFT_655800 [Periconia macrospinosa]
MPGLTIPTNIAMRRKSSRLAEHSIESEKKHAPVATRQVKTPASTAKSHPQLDAVVISCSTYPDKHPYLKPSLIVKLKFAAKAEALRSITNPQVQLFGEKFAGPVNAADTVHTTTR